MWEIKAKNVAEAAHLHQYRKDNITPYILHPARIVNRLDNDIEKSIAWLHDVVEDTSVTLHDLKKVFPKKITDIIEILTHRNESYEEYIDKISRNIIATKIKILDIEDNLNDNPSKKQVEKYRKALATLKNIYKFKY